VTGPVVGAWLDRTPHRRLAFLVSPVVLVVVLSTLLVVARLPGVPDGVFVLLGFVAGLPSPVRTGGVSGLFPTVVPERVLPRAYGLEAASYNLAGIAGPALAGAVAAATSPRWAVAATVLVATVALTVTARVPIAPGRRTAGDRLSVALRAGLALLWQQPALRGITVATTVSQGVFGLVVVAYPLLAVDLHAKAAVGGLLASVFALGALCGSVLYSRAASRLPTETVGYAAMLAFGAGLALLAAAPSLPGALGAAALAGFFDGPLLAATLDLRQRVAPAHLRTQVFTTAASLKIGGFAVGSALAGPTAAAVGARGMLVVAGLGQAAGVVTGLLTRSARGSTRAGPLPDAC
jgi:MFS family permease